MIPYYSWLLISVVMTIPALSTDGRPAYSQSYSIIIKGSVAGTEKVTETTEKDGSLIAVAEHDILISDGLETKRMAFTTTMHLAKGSLAPIRYSYKYTTGESPDFYDVNVKNGQITRVLSRGGRTSEISAPWQPDMVILDFSVYHQYDYLVRKYDFRKKGRQSFPNFMPLIGSEIPISLTYVEDGKFEYEGGSISVRNYRVEYTGLWSASLWTDNDGRLVRLVAPTQDLEVVRTDLMPQKR